MKQIIAQNREEALAFCEAGNPQLQRVAYWREGNKAYRFERLPGSQPTWGEANGLWWDAKTTVAQKLGINPLSQAASALAKSKAGKPRAAQASRENAKKGGRPKSEGFTPLQQRAYDLRLQGLKIKDIAQQMGRQPETIRQLLARAATKLNIPGGWTETARKG